MHGQKLDSPLYEIDNRWARAISFNGKYFGQNLVNAINTAKTDSCPNQPIIPLATNFSGAERLGRVNLPSSFQTGPQSAFLWRIHGRAIESLNLLSQKIPKITKSNLDCDPLSTCCCLVTCSFQENHKTEENLRLIWLLALRNGDGEAAVGVIYLQKTHRRRIHNQDSLSIDQFVGRVSGKSGRSQSKHPLCF